MPVGGAHVILHAALCAAMARAKPDTEFAMRVRVADRRDTVRAEQTFKFARGYDDTKVVELDVPQGSYRLRAEVAGVGCTAMAFEQFIPDHDRVISLALSDEPQAPVVPLLIVGTAPQSFLYIHPTYVLLDKGSVCNKPVGDELPIHVDVENDQDAYYGWLYFDPPYDKPAQLALRLRTSTHQYHYVRIPVPYPPGRSAWPSVMQFDVSQDMVDMLATQPTGVLLCLKLWETMVHY